jgi:hypothetical protein
MTRAIPPTALDGSEVCSGLDMTGPPWGFACGTRLPHRLPAYAFLDKAAIFSWLHRRRVLVAYAEQAPKALQIS